MDTLFERLNPGQIVAVVAIVAGCIVALAMIVGITKYQLQALADETALKREQQQADLAIKQKMVERGGKIGEPSLDLLLTPESPPPDKNRERLNAALAKRFGMLNGTGSEIEDTMTRVLALDSERKTMILEVMDELLANDAPPAAILAAIRPLCGSAHGAERKEPAVAGAC
jgi:hypothetical protein